MTIVDIYDKMPSTPSTNGSSSKSGTPTTATSSATSNGSNASQARRPPRKSTLTQQQKNQKRQRATQDQLILLELEFEKNPTPAGPVRDRIAQEINMTERSVQIWFQNRRAKIKLLTKKTLENGEDCDAIPESYRKYLAFQALDSGKPVARGLLGNAMGSMGNNLLLGGDSQPPPKVIIQHFQCRSLSIGTWRRVGQNAMDLVTFYSLGEKPCLTYYINNESAGYKIEFPFSYIKNITLANGQSEDPSMHPAGLAVELNRPPNFFMDSSGSGGFYQCGDFTENRQASQVLLHHLGGDPGVLSGQLAKLTLLESFQNRHLLDSGAVAMSAPVSPIGHRPASQPNAMPPPTPNAFQDPIYGMSLQPPRGHKRTRSRSVPAITDFSFLSQPTPSFHIQHPSTTITDPSIFAPVPQHPSTFNPSANLRIDTARTYGLDYRQYPMSATTTNSPSEYASPGFFASNPGTSSIDSMPSAPFHPCYSLPFLSPMPETAHSIAPSVSPLSALSPGDPVIADHSPPLNSLHRSASADFLMQQEHSGFSDEGLALSEMYSKQNLNLPIRSPVIDEPSLTMSLQEGPPSEEIDVQAMLPFGTIDPAQLNAEPVSV